MQIERTVQNDIANTGANYLPVGEALIVPTHHDPTNDCCTDYVLPNHNQA